MLSTSSFLTSNIKISQVKNSYIVHTANRPLKDGKTIALSHGSVGIGAAETNLTDYFLENGFTVQLMDHFTPFGIDKLNWTYYEGLKDEYSVSLEEILGSMESRVDEARYHLGISLGGYLGIGSLNLFEKVFACYPGPLPLPDDLFPQNADKVHLFEAEHDQWAQITPELRSLLKKDQIHFFKDSHHSFLTPDKDKLCHVARYKFDKTFYPRSELAKIHLNHDSLSKNSAWTKISVRNKSNSKATNQFKRIIHAQIT